MTAQQIAKGCLLLPGPENVTRRAAALADQCVSGVSFSSARTWFYFAKGMADYRSGRFEEARKHLKTSLDYNDARSPFVDELDHFVMAMASHQLGETGAARRHLGKARQLSNRRLTGGTRTIAMAPSPHIWMHCQIVKREAESLIGDR